MKKEIKKGNLFPQLCLIISTYDENNNVDIMNAARGGVADYDKLFICLDASHKTAKNILLNKGFTVALGTTEYIKECDYVGLVSQNEVKDKIKKLDWTYTPSKKVKAPIINELPYVLECELISYDEESCYLFAAIKGTLVDESILDEKGRVIPNKLEAISYSPFDQGYYVIKERVGNAFKDGMEIKNK